MARLVIKMQTILTVMVNYYTMLMYIHLSIFDEIQVLGTCLKFEKSNNIKEDNHSSIWRFFNAY